VCGVRVKLARKRGAMDFVTLELTSAGIAGRDSRPMRLRTPRLCRGLEALRSAAILHQHMHNRPEQRPRWLTLPQSTDKLVFSDAVASEGIGLLEYVAGWYKRQTKIHRDLSLSIPGRDGPKVELWKGAHYFKYKMGTFRARR